MFRLQSRARFPYCITRVLHRVLYFTICILLTLRISQRLWACRGDLLQEEWNDNFM